MDCFRLEKVQTKSDKNTSKIVSPRFFWYTPIRRIPWNTHHSLPSRLFVCFSSFYRRPLPRPMLPIPGGGGGGSIPGAPTPCIGAAPNPIGAPGTVPCEGGGGIIPRPRAMPVAALPEGGGGPSTAKLTTFSPRISTNPRLRRSCRSSSRAAPLFRKIRNSSASLNTKLRCLSKARKVPTMDRPSCRVTLNRCSTYRSSLLPFPLG